MVIDGDNDLYGERVVDKQTGEVLRDVHEPLRLHKGRGSARQSTANREPGMPILESEDVPDVSPNHSE
jgi:hypothetical protein